MARHPRPAPRVRQTPVTRQAVWGFIKANPKKLITILTILGAIPAAMAGISYIKSQLKPYELAFQTDVHLMRGGKPLHITLAEQEDREIVDLLFLEHLQKKLEKAQADMVKAPNDTTRDRVAQLQKAVVKQEQRLTPRDETDSQ